MENLIIWSDERSPNIQTYQCDDKEVAGMEFEDILSLGRQSAFFHDLGIVLDSKPTINIREEARKIAGVRWADFTHGCVLVFKEKVTPWEDIEPKIFAFIVKTFGEIEKTTRKTTTFQSTEEEFNKKFEECAQRQKAFAAALKALPENPPLLLDRKKFDLTEDDARWIEYMVIELGYPGGFQEFVDTLSFSEPGDILEILESLNYTKVHDFFLGHGSFERVEPYRRRRRELFNPTVSKEVVEKFDYGDLSRPSQNVAHNRAWQLGYDHLCHMVWYHGYTSLTEFVKSHGFESAKEFFFGKEWYNRLQTFLLPSNKAA